MRSLEEIQQAMIAALTRANSPADDLSPGSVLNALIRSASSVVLEQDNKLEEIKANLDVSKLEGSYLDDYALANFNFYRKPGSLARGTVIFSTDASISLTIPRGTILTELNQGLQFITVEGPVTLTSASDLTVEILSIAEGYDYNLEAGTLLYINSSNPNLMQARAEIGYERSPSGEICGGLSGGTTQETDQSLRRRIAEFKAGRGPSLQTAISSYLPVNRAWVTTAAPGFIRVYLDVDSPLTSQFKDDLRERVIPFIPPGVNVAFERATLRPINISIRAVAYQNSSPDLIIRQALELYFESFEPGQVVHPQSIESLVSPYVASVYLETPRRPVVLKPNQLPQLANISICYD